MLACLMVMSCIPAMTLFAFAEEEAYDYNKLYVGDGLRYHLSFIGVDVEEEGLPISYTDGTTTKYGTWQAFEPYALESEVAVSSTNSIIAEKTDITLTPRVYDGYLALHSVNDGTYSYYPISYSGNSFTKTNDYTIQLVASHNNPANAQRNAQLWGPDFRLTVNRAWDSSGTSTTNLITSASFGSINVWGYSSSYMRDSANRPKTGSVTTYDTELAAKEYVFTNANTYTFAVDKDLTNKEFTYDPADYDRAGQGLTVVGVADADMILSDGEKSSVTQTVKSLPDMTDKGIDGVTTFRTDPDHFKGAVVYSGGEMSLDAYVNSQKVIHLAKQPFSANYGDDAYGRSEENASLNLYAYRLYSRVLDEDEIAQNNFADLAKYYELNMHDYDSLTPTQKKAIHQEFKDDTFTYDKDNYATAKASAQAKYTEAYKNQVKTGNECYDAFIEAVVDGGFDISELLKLSKSKKEEIIISLSGSDFTQDDIDTAVANAGVRVNSTTEEQYNSVYEKDGALMLSDFYSATESDVVVKSSSNSKITYDGYYGRYVTDENGDYVYEEDGKTKKVEWIAVLYDNDVAASTKYNGHSSSYTKFIHYTAPFKNESDKDTSLNLSGGTASLGSDVIVTKANNTSTTNLGATAYKAKTNIGNYDYYLYEKANNYGDVSLYTLRVPAGSDLAKRNFEQYVATKGDISDTYIQLNGNFAYESKFYNGYFDKGYFTGLLIDNMSSYITTNAAASAANGGEPFSYTVQVVTSVETDEWTPNGTDGTMAMFSTTRVNFSQVNGNLCLSSIKAMRSTAATNNPSDIDLGVVADVPNELTFSYDSAFTAYSTSGTTTGTMDFDFFVNGKLLDLTDAAKNSVAKYYSPEDAANGTTLKINIAPPSNNGLDTNFKLGEGVDMDIYAVRVYTRSLTADEMAQNHFADLAKYNELDIANLFALSDARKQEIYDIFADITLTEKASDELQSMYDEKWEELYFDSQKIEDDDSHNHIIDLAKFYSLDLAVYNSLPTSAKTELYKKTDAQTLDESIFNVTMQQTFDAWINEAIEDLAAGDSPIVPVDPTDLYVTDGLVSRIDFFDATPSDKVTGGTSDTKISYTGYYYDTATESWKEVVSSYTDVAANTLYNGASSSYTKFFRTNNTFLSPSGTNTTISLSGGTAQIGESWVVNANTTAVRLPTTLDGTNSEAKCIATYTADDGTVYYAAQIYDKDSNVVGTYSYYFPSNNKSNKPFVYATGNPDYYLQTNGSLAFESSFGNGYFSNGYYSGLSIGNLSYLESTLAYDQANALDTKPEADFTLQVVNSFDGSKFRPGGQMFMLGTFRFTLASNGDNMNITSLSKKPSAQTSYDTSKTYDTAYKYRNLGVKITDATDFTFIYSGDFSEVTKSGSSLTSVTGSYDFDMLVNNKLVNFETGATDMYYADADGNHTFEVDFNSAEKFDELFKLGEGGTMNIYAIRIYSKALSQQEIAQNHFADLAEFHDIELDIFSLLTDEEKKAVYAAMQDVYLTDSKESVHEAYEAAINEIYYTSDAEEPTENELHFYELASYYKLNLTEFKKLARKIQLAICDEFADTQMSEEINASIIKIKLNELILLQSDENYADYYGNQMIAFDGYAVRKSSYPGLRSMYTIDKEILASLEERDYTVTFGAIMALATEGLTPDDLVVTEVDGEYKIATPGAASVEVYNDGFVNKYWTNEKGNYGMAFTTTFGESSQNAEMYNTGLMYRAYVVLEKEGEEDKIFYTKNDSSNFDDALTIYDVSAAVKEQRGEAYSMVQEVLNAVDGTDYAYGKIAGVELVDFKFVYDASDEVFATSLIDEMNAVIERKTGVTLKSSTAEAFDGEHAIYIVEREDLGEYNYGVYAEAGNLYITYDYAANAYYAMQTMLSLLDCEGDIIIPSSYSQMGSTPTYKVAFLGDSNTAGAYVFQAVDVYLQTQYPDASIEIINAGTSGGTAAGTLSTNFKNNLTNVSYTADSRFVREVLAENPDIMVISFGINDLQYSGVKTNKGKLQIDRITSTTTDEEISVSEFFDENGKLLAVEEMRTDAFNAKGRINFKTVTYDDEAAFLAAIADTELSAQVKFAVDSALAEDMTDTNVTEFESMMAAYRNVISQCLDAGIDVIIGTPVDYYEQNTTTDAERFIGVKYTFELLVDYAKNTLAQMDGVSVVDYYTPQTEAKATGALLMNDDMKHFKFGAKEARGPFVLANAFMSDVIGTDNFIGAMARDYAFSASVAADSQDGVTFSYKPTGISMAGVDYIASTVTYSNVLDEARKLVSDKQNYNKELIKVTGLDESATYTVTVDGTLLANTYTGAQLALGVDISLDANNPYTRIANEVAKLLADKRVNWSSLRGMSYVHENALIGLLGGHLATDEGITRDMVAENIDEILTDTTVFTSSFLKSCARTFMELYDTLDEIYSQIDLYNYKVKQLLDLGESEIVIAKQ